MNYGAVCGLASAVCLAIPVVRQEIRRIFFAIIERHETDTSILEAAKKGVKDRSYAWNIYDSLFILLGLLLLAVSFIIEILR